ncbi:hypothetical protein E2L06_20870 [Haloterrigena sp. H1]|uniref:hypothetical protein n=1 Tax=Haloterrigena sp. H1 TaxID=2552943 RepID=UPI00110D2938|nr:hypothetical protein [Haloterrigena sp. H1]TMT78010.1 hypothetical protein E2L06_20870 [Haloterrigena sp. H1]
MIPEEPDVSGYAERFHPDKKSRFEDRYEEILSDIDIDDVKPSTKTEIGLEREHVDLVRAISSGFHQNKRAPGADSGFKFSCVDPLANHLDIECEADVLLARTREFNRVQLCVVACEVDDSTVPSWIENANKMHEVFSDPNHQNKILSQIGAGSRTLDAIQYITLVKTEDYEGLSFSEINRQCTPSEYAIWTVEMNGVSELCHEDGDIIHKDLLDAVDDCFDYDLTENPIEYTLSSDPIIPLSNVVYRLVRGKDKYENTEEPLEFTRKEFAERYAGKLKLSVSNDEKEKVISNTVSNLLEIGEDIGIFSKSSTKLDRSDYRVMYQGSADAKTAEDAVSEKYVLEASKKQSKMNAFNLVKDEFDSDQKGLDEFS